jgi:hypothetical protein
MAAASRVCRHSCALHFACIPNVCVWPEPCRETVPKPWFSHRRMQSELLPSAWPVEEPSKDHWGKSCRQGEGGKPWRIVGRQDMSGVPASQRGRSNGTTGGGRLVLSTLGRRGPLAPPQPARANQPVCLASGLKLVTGFWMTLVLERISLKTAPCNGRCGRTPCKQTAHCQDAAVGDTRAGSVHSVTSC